MLQLEVEQQLCRLSLFNVNALAVNPNDLSSLQNADLNAQVPLSSIEVELPLYNGGYTGLFYQNDSVNKVGGVSFHGFVLNREEVISR